MISCLPLRRRRFPRKKHLISFACTLLILYFLYFGYEWFSFGYTVYKRDWNCDELRARKHLATLCSDYKSGHVGGNLCHDLCITRDLVLPDCMAHKNTTIVFSGKWKGKDIVFKIKQEPLELQNIPEFVLENRKGARGGENSDGFAQHVYEQVLNEVNYPHLKQLLTPQQTLQIMYVPHLAHNLSIADKKSLWKILQQHEFVKLQLLQGSKHIPRIYGFCGNYYAVEKVTSLEEFTSPFMRPKPWTKRVDVAVGLLELLKEFNNTFLGALTHCDIQPGNFGISKEGVILAIDLDTVFSGPQAWEYLGQGKCTKDKDCSFFDCISACNKTSSICSSKILTNNLQVLCRDLFVLSMWAEPGILNISPIYAANKLKPILDECIAENTLPWTEDKKKAIFDNLYGLLQTELQ